MKRRDVLKTFTVAAAGSAVSGIIGSVGADEIETAAAGNLLRPAETERGDMRYRKLGRTGEEVSLIGVGGYHIGSVKDVREATKIVRTAIDRGVTFMDNCWDYHDGESERRMGKALKNGYRDKVFLMTKIDGRTKQEAAKQIDESLKRLRQITSISCSITKTSGWKTPIGFSPMAGRWRHLTMRRRQGRFATSVLPAIRIQLCTCGCSTWPKSTISISTRRRCRST